MTDHVCVGRTDGYGGFTCVQCGEHHPADHLGDDTEKVPMDREAVLSRMEEAVQGIQPLYGDLGPAKEYAEAALDASGLMPRLEALQAELRHLKGRPAVPGKPMQLQSRDELLAAINERNLLIESQQSMIRELDGKLAEVARKDAALEAVKSHAIAQDCGRMCDSNPKLVYWEQWKRSEQYVEGIIRQAVSPAPSNPPSQPTNSPTDQPQE